MAKLYERRACQILFTVCQAVRLTLESIEVPFFRRLDEHFFALQTIFGVLHVRPGNVCLKTRFKTRPFQLHDAN